MILAIDVHYRETFAKAVGALFEWDDMVPKKVFVEHINDVDEYIPGEFYKRELPCLIKVIEHVDINALEAIVIDGYIYVDNKFQSGLGAYLFENLRQKVPIIGVAKTSFFANKETVIPIIRGDSKNPLFVSSINYPLEEAAHKIQIMKGEYRIPTLLKELDKITKDDTLGN